MASMKTSIGCGSDSTGDRRIRKRSRKNKARPFAKPSFLSARLNPDFDPKYIASEVNYGPNIDRNAEELDPKTMEFDALAEFLHPSFIFDYLHKSLHFLKSNQKELCFPHIAPYKEAFLVKIVEDYKHLRSRVFNEASVIVARQILEVLERNKRMYKWVHAYEDGLLNKNVLVYKKLNISNENEQFKVPCSGTPSVSSTSMEDMTNSSQDRQEISHAFKLDTLNTTLKFIKDDTRLNLEYPTMSLKHAHFVYSLIHQDNTDCDVGFGFKSLYAPLRDVMGSMKEKFEFKVSFVESIDRLAVRILLQKVPKTNDADSCGEKQTDLNSSTASVSTTSSHSSSHLSKAQKDLLSKQRLIESLPEDFIKDSLMKLVEFVEDPRSASVLVRNVDENCGRFLEALIGIARNTDLHRCFSEECVVLLKRLRAPKESSTVRSTMGKMVRGTGLRTITFFKLPAFSAKYHEQITITVDNTPKNNETNKDLPSESLQANSRSVSIERKTRPRYSIAFESAGTQIIDSAGASVDSGDGADVADGASWRLPGRKGKLLEAMSTPVESLSAERMMRRMGWDGGALGIRGEGIIEPIIPALHLAPGAGLGHVKQIKQIEKSMDRTKFLQDVLSFIRSPSMDATTLSFTQPLTKKEGRFLRAAEAAFNKRKSVGLSLPEEKAIVEQIMEELVKDMHLQVAFNVGNERKILHLKKKINPELKISKKKKKIKSQHNTSIDSDNSTDQPLSKTLSYRISCLEKIRDFVSLEKETAEYHFECVLNTKQRNFIQTLITDLNRKVNKMSMSVQAHETQVNKVYKEIRQIAGDCYLTADICGQKMTLQKKYYRKRFINSTLGLPPPKSTDLKNTIIYVNNVVTCQGDAANQEYDIKKDNIIHPDKNILNHDDGDNILNNDSDDDVLIISENNDIISICGDENVTQETEYLHIDEDFVGIENGAAKDSVSLGASNESESEITGDSERDSSKKDINLEDDIAKAEVNNNYDVIIDRNEEKDKNNLIYENKDSENGETSSFTSSKRSHSGSNSSYLTPKKCKYEKYISIISDDNKEITLDLVKKVQNLISDSVNENFLPLLKCHGVKNGGLIYSCHSEKSVGWLEKVIRDASVKIVDTDYVDWNVRKMTMKINSYIKVDMQTLLSRLEMYNPGLDTSRWIVISQEIHEDFALYKLGLDRHSYNYICKSCFALYVGIDEVQFSIVWD